MDCVAKDFIPCENAVFELTPTSTEPNNFITLFQDHDIQIHCAHGFYETIEGETSKHLVYTCFGGPTGLWSTYSEGEPFSEWSISTKYFIWQALKDFKDDNLQWFLMDQGYYFNAKNNVYQLTGKEPFYELIWENRQIVQISGQESLYIHGCLLNNGEFWVKDNYVRGFFRNIKKNSLNWFHLPFFDDKNVKNIGVTTDEIIFVLCEYPDAQKLFYYKDLKDSETIPRENVLMNEKTILKILNLHQYILCWCIEGLYVCTQLSSDSFHLVTWFEDKNILDIGVSGNFYVLCDDGVYVIPSINDPETFLSQLVDATIAPIELPYFNENMPLIFSSYLSCKFEKTKSARF